jgi:hypothetical protein
MHILLVLYAAFANKSGRTSEFSDFMCKATLTHTPDDLLRHIGSPFVPDKRSTQSQERAARSTWKHLAIQD